MNIFYAPPAQVFENHIELTGQEAKHASKVLRYREGDAIQIVDGRGGWYKCEIVQIANALVKAEVKSSKKVEARKPSLLLAMGLIKKRDRLEFAVEKAVELGVSEIALFRSHHTVKENVRMDRLQMTTVSAMKQSLRAYLPEISVFNSLEEVIETYTDCHCLVAHEKEESAPGIIAEYKTHSKLLLVVGPEGGLSEDEVALATERGAQLVSLGDYRLRTETAAIAFLSQFIYI